MAQLKLQPDKLQGHYSQEAVGRARTYYDRLTAMGEEATRRWPLDHDRRKDEELSGERTFWQEVPWQFMSRLYEALALRHPFADATQMDALRKKVLAGAFPPLPAGCASRPVLALLARMLHAAPGMRPSAAVREQRPPAPSATQLNSLSPGRSSLRLL